MEACASSHHWAREISALGHDVRLIPPQYVKPFVKRGKTDATDAEAIREAVTRPTMRFVPVKSAEQQAAVMVLRTRALLVHERMQSINALRGHLGELGIVASSGVANIKTLAAVIRDGEDARLPRAARFALMEIPETIKGLSARIDRLEREIVAEARRDPDLRRLATIPGVGPIISMAVKAFAPDPGGSASARHFAAWIGLTPKAHSSGGKVPVQGSGEPHDGRKVRFDRVIDPGRKRVCFATTQDAFEAHGEVPHRCEGRGASLESFDFSRLFQGEFTSWFDAERGHDNRGYRVPRFPVPDRAE
jgi:transposase